MNIESPNFNNFKEHDKDKPKSPERRRFLKGTGKFLAGAGSALVVEKGIKEKEKIAGFLQKATKGISMAIKRFREEDQGQIAKTEKMKTKEHRKRVEIQNISDHYLLAYKELSQKSEYLPPEIFSKDFFIAQQLQESGFDKKAKSNKGAVGVMQITKPAIQDVSKYLRQLHIAGVIDYHGPVYLKKPRRRKYKSERKYKQALTNYYDEYKKLRLKPEDLLTDEDIDDIKFESMENADYSRAIGKLYFMKLFDKKRGYAVGWREYQQGNIHEARRLLLACYNAGKGGVYINNHVKPETQWPKETRDYVYKIFNYMQRIKNVRQAFKERGLDPDWDYAVMSVARAMDGAGDLRGRARKEKLRKIMAKSISRIKTN